MHRKIGPRNFLVGRRGTEAANVIHVINFRMAKLYRHPETKKHIPYREGKLGVGTTRFMSIDAHLGREQSRKDDLEALGYILIYFLSGRLPWKGDKSYYEKVGEKKKKTSIKDLCRGYPGS
jgi:casein kinase 1